MTQTLRFTLPGGREREITVRYALNAGYAGRDTEQVQHHVDQLAELGVPAPRRIPTLYPLSASWSDGRTSSRSRTRRRPGRRSGRWSLGRATSC